MKYNKEQIDNIQAITLQHYSERAEDFWQGTKGHDVSQNYRAFLSAMPATQELDILDFGCGPGRDVQYFKSLGHRPVGLDGSEAFCEMASAYTACPILHQAFLSLDLVASSFDGIFANASLFHVPSQALPRVLGQLRSALRPGGILFTSNPRGNEEGWIGQRFAHHMQLDASTRFLNAAGFEVLTHYYRPEGKPCHEQRWLAMVSRKTALSGGKA
ncbi:MAG: class I SAM-dependent methyltransferase [Gammaproteobacteria bacterium]|nr:class I SAM-dependent methyltransferase [Gammaproteobacteria bacterium]